jgi:hypothetical protein
MLACEEKYIACKGKKGNYILEAEKGKPFVLFTYFFLISEKLFACEGQQY